MKSALLIGLTGLAANVNAHPTKQPENGNSLAKRGIDISKYHLPTLSQYTPLPNIEEEASLQSLAYKRNYVDTATRAVKKVAPNAEFRVVDDHYIDIDGIGHVHFKQTVHGIDIDNADFKVNVSRGKTNSYKWLHADKRRLAKTAESFLTETASSRASCRNRAPLRSATSLTPPRLLKVLLTSLAFRFKLMVPPRRLSKALRSTH